MSRCSAEPESKFTYPPITPHDVGMTITELKAIITVKKIPGTTTVHTAAPILMTVRGVTQTAPVLMTVHGITQTAPRTVISRKESSPSHGLGEPLGYSMRQRSHRLRCQKMSRC
ncbi:hypothetical protein LSAT2_002930, partial [Lamellibrachia satsuma]